MRPETQRVPTEAIGGDSPQHRVDLSRESLTDLGLGLDPSSVAFRSCSDEWRTKWKLARPDAIGPRLQSQ